MDAACDSNIAHSALSMLHITLQPYRIDPGRAPSTIDNYKTAKTLINTFLEEKRPGLSLENVHATEVF